VAEAMRDAGNWTEPSAWESLVRGWHLEGLAVRPQHRMHGHTGFLITSRRLAPGVTPPQRKRRPGKGYEGLEESEGRPAEVMPGASDEEWTSEAIGERVPSDKRVRKVRRSVTG
ncbi:MAG: tRNA (adenine-N1)-methyltransferase, partial [Knoellia sp.]